jgi:tetratricopeptide (TPR) repeat protein
MILNKNYIIILVLIIVSFNAFTQQVNPKNNEQTIENKIRISELEKKVDQLKAELTQQTTDQITKSEDKLKPKSENLESKKDAIGWWLTSLGILVTVFGVVIPILSFFYGRKLLKDIEKQTDKTKDELRVFKSEEKESIKEFIESSKEKLNRLEKEASGCIERLKVDEQIGHDVTSKLQKLTENTMKQDRTEEENKTSIKVAKALENNPTASPFNKAMAKALELYLSKNYDKALIHFNELLIAYKNEITMDKLASIYFYIANINSENKDYKTAIEYNKKAVELMPNFKEAYNNLGYNFRNLANATEDKSKKERLQFLAIEKYQKAIEINPNYHEAYNNWGVSLKSLADNEDNEIEKEKEKLYLLAIEKCQKAKEISPDYQLAYNNLGGILINLSKIKTGEEKEKILNDAEEYCKKSMNLGGSCYNLACVYALKNIREESFKWLAIALEKGYTTFKFVENDEDWKDLREESEYLKLKEKYFIA